MGTAGCPATNGLRLELKQVIQALLELLHAPQFSEELLSEQIRDWQTKKQEMLQLTHALTLSSAEFPVLTVPQSMGHSSGDPLFAVLLTLGIVCDFVQAILRKRR
jgi:hypothetical protein